MSEDDKDKPSNVVSLAGAVNDAAFWTVEEMLLDALEDVRSGKRSQKKALLLLLDDENGRFNISFSNAQMKPTEMITVASCFSSEIQSLLGYGKGEAYE